MNNRGQALFALSGCNEYMRYSQEWAGSEDERNRIVLDGRFTVEQLEAIVFLMRNAPELLRK